MKTVWYCHKARHIDQQTRIEGPQMNPYTHGPWFSTRVPRPSRGKRTVFSTSGARTTGDAHAKRRKLGPSVWTHTKINSKWTKDLAINTKTIKLLKEKMEVNLHDLGFGNSFLDIAPNAQAVKENKIHTLDFIKILARRDTCTRVKRQRGAWEEIFSNHVSDKGLISRIQKGLSRPDNKRTTTL